MNPRRKVTFAFILVLAVSTLTSLSMTAYAQTSMPSAAPTAGPESNDYPYYITYNPAISIPEFTIQLKDYSNDVPPTTTTSIDPYTGNETVTTQPGYHVGNKTIEFTIYNQPHRSEFIPSQYGVNLYYDIRVKGHFAGNWGGLYLFDAETNSLPIASNATYTTVSIPNGYPQNGTVDFQIRAINGTVRATFPGMRSPFYSWCYEASGWSDIQTLNLYDGSISTTPYTNPTVSPVPTPNPTVQLATVSPSPIQPTASATETSAPANGDNTALDTTSILVVVVIVLVVVIAALTAALLRKNRTKQ